MELIDLPCSAAWRNWNMAKPGRRRSRSAIDNYRLKAGRILLRLKVAIAAEAA
jgi:hypothetical protein